VVALIVAVGLSLMRNSITDIETALFFLLGMIALIAIKLDPALLILGGGLIGLIKMILKV
jgi:chromate transport protein ChrA